MSIFDAAGPVKFSTHNLEVEIHAIDHENKEVARCKVSIIH